MPSVMGDLRRVWLSCLFPLVFLFQNDIKLFGFSISLSVPMVRVIVLNATFNNISVISSRSVLLLEETGVPEENH